MTACSFSPLFGELMNGVTASKVGLSDENRMTQGYFRLFQNVRCIGGWLLCRGYGYQVHENQFERVRPLKILSDGIYPNDLALHVGRSAVGGRAGVGTALHAAFF